MKLMMSLVCLLHSQPTSMSSNSAHSALQMWCWPPTTETQYQVKIQTTKFGSDHLFTKNFKAALHCWVLGSAH